MASYSENLGKALRELRDAMADRVAELNTLRLALETYDQFGAVDLHRRYNVVCGEVKVFEFVLATLEKV